MYKILVISPISIAGALILKGFAKGFENLGHNILFLDVRNLDYSTIKDFNPDFAFGYDYAHFVLENAEQTIKSLDIPVVHYFADAPDLNFSLSGDLELINKLQNSPNKVYFWDKSYLDFFKHKKTHYLPLAVDPDLYKVKGLTLGEDFPEITFAGRPLTPTRINLLTEIIKKFPDKLGIYSFKKHFDTSVQEIKKQNLLNESQLDCYISSYKGFLETEEELAKVYNKSSIVLNITMDQGINSMNYRIFEVLAAEGFLITDFRENTAKYFLENRDLVFYKNTEQLLLLIDKYLKNKSSRLEIAKNGRKNIEKNHTFKQRARIVIDNLCSYMN